jgi:hypothetical protein
MADISSGVGTKRVGHNETLEIDRLALADAGEIMSREARRDRETSRVLITASGSRQDARANRASMRIEEPRHPIPAGAGPGMGTEHLHAGGSFRWFSAACSTPV